MIAEANADGLKVIFPLLAMVKRAIPEADAVRSAWSPVSLNIAKALPVSAPVTLSLPVSGAEEPTRRLPD